MASLVGADVTDGDSVESVPATTYVDETRVGLKFYLVVDFGADFYGDSIEMIRIAAATKFEHRAWWALAV